MRFTCNAAAKHCRLKIVLGYRCLLHGKSHDPSLAQVSVGLFGALESPRFVVIAEAFRVRPAADNLKLCAAQNCVHNSGLYSVELKARRTPDRL
jgi:hypothetical protein